MVYEQRKADRCRGEIKGRIFSHQKKSVSTVSHGRPCDIMFFFLSANRIREEMDEKKSARSRICKSAGLEIKRERGRQRMWLGGDRESERGDRKENELRERRPGSLSARRD